MIGVRSNPKKSIIIYLCLQWNITLTQREINLNRLTDHLTRTGAEVVVPLKTLSRHPPEPQKPLEKLFQVWAESWLEWLSEYQPRMSQSLTWLSQLESE